MVTYDKTEITKFEELKGDAAWSTLCPMGGVENIEQAKSLANWGHWHVCEKWNRNKSEKEQVGNTQSFVSTVCVAHEAMFKAAWPKILDFNLLMYNRASTEPEWKEKWQKAWNTFSIDDFRVFMLTTQAKRISSEAIKPEAYDAELHAALSLVKKFTFEEVEFLYRANIFWGRQPILESIFKLGRGSLSELCHIAPASWGKLRQQIQALTSANRAADSTLEGVRKQLADALTEKSKAHDKLKEVQKELEALKQTPGNVAAADTTVKVRGIAYNLRAAASKLETTLSEIDTLKGKIKAMEEALKKPTKNEHKAFRQVIDNYLPKFKLGGADTSSSLCKTAILMANALVTASKDWTLPYLNTAIVFFSNGFTNASTNPATSELEQAEWWATHFTSLGDSFFSTNSAPATTYSDKVKSWFAAPFKGLFAGAKKIASSARKLVKPDDPNNLSYFDQYKLFWKSTFKAPFRWVKSPGFMGKLVNYFSGVLSAPFIAVGAVLSPLADGLSNIVSGETLIADKAHRLEIERLSNVLNNANPPPPDTLTALKRATFTSFLAKRDLLDDSCTLKGLDTLDKFTPVWEKFVAATPVESFDAWYDANHTGGKIGSVMSFAPVDWANI